MTTAIHSHPEPCFEQSEADAGSEVCRAVVFSIANHFLALPLAAVLKVVPQSAVQSNYSEQQPVVYLDNQPLTRLNLHSCLAAIPGSHALSAPMSPGSLLLIAGLQGVPQWAVPVDQPPTLMELPLSTVRLLPIAYRQRIQNLACYVAVLADQPELLTVLLLNLEQAAAMRS